MLDLGRATLLLSAQSLRELAPHASIEQARDVSRGLPKQLLGCDRIRWHESGLLGIHQYPRGTGNDYLWFHLAEDGWIQVAIPSNVEALLPYGSDALAIEWADKPTGDPIGVPIGNVTRAWAVSGTSAEPLRGWPDVMTWSHRTSNHAVWATAARPRVAGKFLLYFPRNGPARFFAIPGRASCQGADRYVFAEDLVEVTDDSATLDVQRADYGTCRASAQDSGRYQFLLGPRRWHRQGEIPPHTVLAMPFDRRYAPTTVQGSGSTFHLENGLLSIENHAGAAAYMLGGSEYGELKTTANGQELWVSVGRESAFKLYRYKWSGDT